MRRATHDTGWIYNSSGELAGIALGWDFTAEHEDDAAKFLRAFGTNLPDFPIGIDARQITRLPENLQFHEYEHKYKERGSRKRPKGIPAAVLMSIYPWQAQRPLEEHIGGNELSFYGASTGTDETDVACSWAYSDFGIHVRGAEQVARLKELIQAFNELDICLAPPGGGGFVGRRGPSFVIRSRVDDETRSQIEARDRAALRLEEAVLASGIREALQNAGCRHFALMPSWINGETEEGLKFFLNPFDQQRCHHGWFTVEELQQWAQRSGPVMKDERLEAFAKKHRDWGCDVLRRLNHAGIQIGYSRLAWADEAQKRVGVFLRPPVSGGGIPEGVYPYDEMVARYPLPSGTQAVVS